MKLIITDYGDPSVGIFSSTYEITCPFEKDDTDDGDLDIFRSDGLRLYEGFAQGKLVAEYDFEVQEKEIELTKGIKNQENCGWKDDCSYFDNNGKCSEKCIKYNY